MQDDDRLRERAARLNALSALERDDLALVIGEAALDLWSRGECWPDLVDRCLEAFTDGDPANGRVVVTRSSEEPADA